MKQENPIAETKALVLYSISTHWFQQLHISFAFYLRLLIFYWLNQAKKCISKKLFLMYFLHVFCVKKTAVDDLQKLESTHLASHE